MKKVQLVRFVVISFCGLMQAAAFAGATTPITMQVTNATYAVVSPNPYHYCDATAFVQNVCNGEKECKVYVNDAICGDPSPGILKHLTTEYQCGINAYEKDTPEYGTAILSCSNPMAIPGTKKIR